MAGRNAQSNPTTLMARQRSRQLAAEEKQKNRERISALKGEDRIRYEIEVQESNIEVLDYDLSRIHNKENPLILKKKEMCIKKIEELKKELENVNNETD